MNQTPLTEEQFQQIEELLAERNTITKIVAIAGAIAAVITAVGSLITAIALLTRGN